MTTDAPTLESLDRELDALDERVNDLLQDFGALRRLMVCWFADTAHRQAPAADQFLRDMSHTANRLPVEAQAEALSRLIVDIRATASTLVSSPH